MGACTLACGAEEREFGDVDAAVKGDDDEQSSGAEGDSGTHGDVDDSVSDGDATAPPEPTVDDADDEPPPDTENSDDVAGDDTDTPTSSVDSGGATQPDQGDAGTDPTAGNGPDGGSSPACTNHTHCDDLNPCNGEESCVEGACELGTWADNGAQCELGEDAALRVCSDGNCVLSICGDGHADERNEVCDDANGDNGDGCTVACAYSCTADEQCDDTLLCNGAEVCEPELHACVAGEPAEDGTECGEEQLCHAGACVPAGCGNGELELDTEECDDGNFDDGDGCDADCTYSCVEDAQCDDASVCTGQETCDLETHACVAGEPLYCAAPDDCNLAECDPVGGCYVVLIDADGDGQASDELECGSDCDDGDATIYSGAAELCDDKDNNCNDSTDETAPTWYTDCDGDGFAPVNAAGTQQCNVPEQPPAECAGRGLVGAWTSTAPASGNEDCWDDSAAVHPMNSTQNDAAWSQYSIEGRPVSVDFDYNCDGDEEKRYTKQAGTSCTEGLVFEPAAAGGGGIIIPQLCYGTDGWTGTTIPDCEDQAAWKDCTRVDGECAWAPTTMHQSCR
jgi:cysteine-rich repeat protein